jgi:hypothetical protein
MHSNGHVRFGGRAGETGREQSRYCAPARPYRHYRLQLTSEPESGLVKLERGRLRMPGALADAGHGKEAIVRWYQQRAMTWLPRRIGPWAQRMGMQPGDLEVRDLGYRWGSLGRDDRLNIHWAAMQLPASLIDYVLVHELATSASPATRPPSGPPSSEPSPATTSAAPALPPSAQRSGSADTGISATLAANCGGRSSHLEARVPGKLSDAHSHLGSA